MRPREYRERACGATFAEGRERALERGERRISDITRGPRNPALTRVITGPNGPPDIYMISVNTQAEWLSKRRPAKVEVRKVGLTLFWDDQLSERGMCEPLVPAHYHFWFPCQADLG
jgi:hypothetical protein